MLICWIGTINTQLWWNNISWQYNQKRKLLECAYAHIRTNKNSNITQFYTRLAKTKGNSKAAVAAASKLLKIVYWVMNKKSTIVIVKESYYVFRIEKKSLENLTVDSLNK